MYTRMSLQTGLAALLITVVAGCQNTELESRITMLEDTNATLTSELNRAQNELGHARQQLGMANSDRNQWDQALAAARREADDLRNQLANMPVPEQAAPGWTAVPGGAMIAIEGSVLFSPGKVVLRDQAKRALDRIVSTVQSEYGDKDILVFGHTDNTPIKKSGWEDNWQLSSERALSVARYLNSRGVSSSRLVACGCGEHRPIAGNDSKTNRGKNRRVEIFAIEPQAQTGRP